MYKPTRAERAALFATIEYLSCPGATYPNRKPVSARQRKYFTEWLQRRGALPRPRARQKTR